MDNIGQKTILTVWIFLSQEEKVFPLDRNYFSLKGEFFLWVDVFSLPGKWFL